MKTIKEAHGLCALIDGDIPLYAWGFAGEHKIYSVSIKGEEQYGSMTFDTKTALNAWAKEFKYDLDKLNISHEVILRPYSHVVHALNNLIDFIMSRTKATDYKIYLTGEGNFREKVAVTHVYKGNRDKLNKPFYYDALKNHMITQLGAEVVGGLEADDMLAIEHTKAPDNSIICTTDKDLDGVPGLHFNWNKDLVYKVSSAQAWRFFWTQVLTGDPTDNIKGIYGIGPVKAAEILEQCITVDDLKCAVGMAYALAFDDPEQRMQENMDLLYIKRSLFDRQTLC